MALEKDVQQRIDKLFFSGEWEADFVESMLGMMRPVSMMGINFEDWCSREHPLVSVDFMLRTLNRLLKRIDQESLTMQ